MPTDRSGAAISSPVLGVYPTYWIEGKDAPPQWSIERLGKVPGANPIGGTHAEASPYAPVGTSNFSGALAQGPGDDFFEKIILLPRQIDAGLVLSTLNYTVQLYSSYRKAIRAFTSYTSSAGAGVYFTGLPTIPSTIQPQTGWTLTLWITADGPPEIDGELIFGFDTGDIILYLTGQRTVLLPFEPEAPIVERLQWLTDILTHKNGKEQRVSLRLAPRQIFEVEFQVTDYQRRCLESMIFSVQEKALGFPVWHEAAILTAAASIGDDTIYVDSTQYVDLRDGGLAAIYANEALYETLEILSKTTTSITFASTLLSNFPAGARVLPVRIVYANQVGRGERYPVGLQSLRLILTALDNTVDLSSTVGFSTFNSKVLLDDPNAMDETLPETFEKELLTWDNETGVFMVASRWPMGRRGHAKRFVSSNRQALWQIRCLLHALRGRQISFYIPTFYDDLLVTRDVTAGSATLTVQNVGYTKYINAVAPRNVIRLTKTDGTSAIRTITGAAVIDENEEQLTLNSNWGINATIAQVRRVDFIEKVRMDSDEAVLTHQDALGWSTVDIPVKAVLE